MRSDEITRAAPAKINLTLDVGARRADGYHDIRSVVQTTALCDTVTVRRMSGRTGVVLEVVGDEAAGVPADETNLVYQATARLQSLASERGQVSTDRSGLHIRLGKRIPSQAGLGGGSSDAATALLLANQVLSLNLSQAELTRIGLTLGADVPFFLTGGTALVEGRGEQVNSLPPLEPDWDLMIVKPPVGISTAAAYAALDVVPGRVPGGATAAWLAGTQTPRNDFQEVALGLSEVAAVLEALPDAPLMLCGSGSALFCRIRNEAEGKRLAARVVERRLGKVWLTRTVGVRG